MKQRLVVISDMWGEGQSEWLSLYKETLERNFDVSYYDACQIAEINTNIYTETNIHQQFVAKGIDVGVNFLLKNERTTSHVLAFSVGGVIAWKAVLLGMLVDQMYLVSATRIRYEIERPLGSINTFFGAEDVYKPTPDWFASLNIETHEFTDVGHQLYKNPSCAEMILECICKKINIESN